MKVKNFSPKQINVLTWWHPNASCFEKSAIICDGAVRSGKTFCLSVSFALWAFAIFDNTDFAFCGKTIISLKRNLVNPLISFLATIGFKSKLIASRNLLIIEYRGRTNRFHLFGGRDEGSAALIQGITLGGVLFDEVALMPQSFVEQALARCSLENAKYWFNCNPEHPSHWFYTEWIKRYRERNALYIHFKMEDNPSLSENVLARYKNMYSGVFYKRYVLGEWVATYGAVYPMFSYSKHVVNKAPCCSKYLVSCDYGTTNPTSLGLWGYSNNVWYRVAEYYHCSRTSGVVKTDEQYYSALESLAYGKDIEAVIVDPSAASFIQCIKSKGRFSVVPAKNSVLNGIRQVSSYLDEGKIKLSTSCKKSIEEFSLYRWNLNSIKEEPVKENDHAMDDIRYFVQYVSSNNESAEFYVLTAKRK